ncbi:MAG: ABC transporter substrate-binding protein [Syntrophobacteraceae bacterium]|jgi:NitT/TauT family transport system substrate-binding protein
MITRFATVALTVSAFLLAAIFLTVSTSLAQDHIRIGHLPVTGHAKLFIAKEKGFFAEEEIDAELIEFINSADGLTALRSGKIDVGSFGTTAPLVHIAQGADLRMIGGIMGEDAAIVTKSDRAQTVKSVADLKGKKVATVRLATGDAVFRGALESAGISPRKDLQIFELKSPPAVIEAVKSGEVDAGVVWGPHDLIAEKNGLAVVIRSRSLSPGHPCCRITLTNDTLQKNPAVWIRFLRAVLKAEKFAKDHHEETVDIILKYVKLDPDTIRKAFYEGYLEQGSDPNTSGVKKFWHTMQMSEFISSKLDISPFIVTDLYKSALDSLAKENPKDPFWVNLQTVYSERNP